MTTSAVSAQIQLPILRRDSESSLGKTASKIYSLAVDLLKVSFGVLIGFSLALPLCHPKVQIFSFAIPFCGSFLGSLAGCALFYCLFSKELPPKEVSQEAPLPPSFESRSDASSQDPLLFGQIRSSSSTSSSNSHINPSPSSHRGADPSSLGPILLEPAARSPSPSSSDSQPSQRASEQPGEPAGPIPIPVKIPPCPREEEEKIRELMNTLATSSTFSLGFNKSKLEQEGSRIEKTTNQLRFIIFISKDTQARGSIISILKKTFVKTGFITGITERMLLDPPIVSCLNLPKATFDFYLNGIKGLKQQNSKDESDKKKKAILDKIKLSINPNSPLCKTEYQNFVEGSSKEPEYPKEFINYIAEFATEMGCDENKIRRSIRWCVQKQDFGPFVMSLFLEGGVPLK